jgi:hypothetical protein
LRRYFLLQFVPFSVAFFNSSLLPFFPSSSHRRLTSAAGSLCRDDRRSSPRTRWLEVLGVNSTVEEKQKTKTTKFKEIGD